MVRQGTILILFTILLMGCNNIDQKSTMTSENNGKGDFTEIMFSNKFGNKSVQESSQQIAEAEFSPVYIGVSKKQIELEYKIENIGNRTEEYDKFDRPTKNTFVIFIDTSRNLPSPAKILPPVKLGKKEKEKNIIAYPVFFQNLSKDTIQIGVGDIIPMIIEAKDEKGIWRPIQKRFIYGCATGLTKFFLAPNQIGITAMKQFTGTFKTELRIAFLSKKNIHSNTIQGFINPEQFE